MSVSESSKTDGAPQRGGSLPSRPRPHSLDSDRLTIEDHLETILRAIGPLAAYDQPIVESLGLTLQSDVHAELSLPRHDCASIDGYAVSASDLRGVSAMSPTELPVVGEIINGSSKSFAINPGTTVKISAGAPLPRGADAVVPLGSTSAGRSGVYIRASIAAGDYVRKEAEDVADGELVLAEGTVLGPREIGLLAALGHTRVQARPRPRVVVISVGPELRDADGHLDHDSVYDANSYMLAAAIRGTGAIAFRVGVVESDPEVFRRVLSDQLVRADLVVTSGGIGNAQQDIVRQVLSEDGKVQFVDVALEPGRIQGFGTVLDEPTPILALPTDPVAAFVSFEVFVLPAIRRLMGRAPYRRPQVHAVLAADVASAPGHREYVRAFFEVTHRGAKVTPIEGRGHHRVNALAKANALIVVGEDETALNMGDTVRTLVLDRSF